jgi:hypothetical protein
VRCDAQCKDGQNPGGVSRYIAPSSQKAAASRNFSNGSPLRYRVGEANLPIGESTMASIIHSSPYTRREIIRAGALAVIPLALPAAIHAQQGQPPEGQTTMTANGGTDPYPIPWLDKNGSHNQPAGPNLEPAHIYHFKGRVARSSTFTGIHSTPQNATTQSSEKKRTAAITTCERGKN